MTNPPQIQEIVEQDRHIHYHFRNCGTVYVDSHNVRNVTTENCGNMIQSSSFLFSFVFMDIHRSSRIIQIIVLGPFSLRRTIEFYIPNPMQSPKVRHHLPSSLNMLNIYSSFWVAGIQQIF